MHGLSVILMTVFILILSYCWLQHWVRVETLRKLHGESDYCTSVLTVAVLFSLLFSLWQSWLILMSFGNLLFSHRWASDPQQLTALSTSYQRCLEATTLIMVHWHHIHKRQLQLQLIRFNCIKHRWLNRPEHTRHHVSHETPEHTRHHVSHETPLPV